MKIFYAWQSDTPRRIGKTFIRKALDAAVSEISDTINLDVAQRPSVDQDTQGILGSPAIAETIFQRIRLRHRRWPVKFEIAPDAPANKRKEVLQALSRDLVGILIQYTRQRSPGEARGSTQSLSKKVKLYLSEARYHVQLNDLVSVEI